MDDYTEKIGFEEEISSEFFSVGYRKLGLRTMVTSSTFNDVTYHISNAATKALIEEVFGVMI
jgi:hypothetical protein